MSLKTIAWACAAANTQGVALTIPAEQTEKAGARLEKEGHLPMCAAAPKNESFWNYDREVDHKLQHRQSLEVTDLSHTRDRFSYQIRQMVTVQSIADIIPGRLHRQSTRHRPQVQPCPHPTLL